MLFVDSYIVAFQGDCIYIVDCSFLSPFCRGGSILSYYDLAPHTVTSLLLVTFGARDCVVISFLRPSYDHSVHVPCRMTPGMTLDSKAALYRIKPLASFVIFIYF